MYNGWRFLLFSIRGTFIAEAPDPLESPSQNHSQKRRVRESSATAYGVFDCDFGFDSQEWVCSHAIATFCERSVRDGDDADGGAGLLAGCGHRRCPLHWPACCAPERLQHDPLIISRPHACVRACACVRDTRHWRRVMSTSCVCVWVCVCG